MTHLKGGRRRDPETGIAVGIGNDALPYRSVKAECPKSPRRALERAPNLLPASAGGAQAFIQRPPPLVFEVE